MKFNRKRKPRRGLPLELRKSALLRLADIHTAMYSLVFDVLNHHAPVRDIDRVLYLMNCIEKLEIKVGNYPIIPEHVPDNSARWPPLKVVK
jgi:hypothetical protein